MENKVYLVGAGIGDEKLITVKGLEKIKTADVIIYDRLLNDNLLSYAKDDCKKIYAGKKVSDHTIKQDGINELLVKYGKQEKIVVRLKGGDPYVFGRGSEEAIYLNDHNISFEVVPGITSPIGGLNYAGIPVTTRDVSSSFHVFTGHFKNNNKDKFDFKSITNLDGTIVFLMGMKNLDFITNSLIKNGMDKDKPVAIVQWAGFHKQKSIQGSLNNICHKVKESGISSPALIVIGNVVKMKNKLNYFEKLPLFNKKVGITRPSDKNKYLSDKISELGAKPVKIPTIKVKKINQLKLKEEIKNINKYSWIVLTSRNAVEVFMDSIQDIRILNNIKFAVTGKSTKKELLKYKIKADLIPKHFVQESLIKELKNVLKKEDKVLVPRSKLARSLLIDELNKICFVKEIKTYTLEKLKINLDKSIDYLTFTSPSTFNNLYQQVNEKIIKESKIITIGPITSKAVKEKGFDVYKQARDYTIDGLIKCLKEEKNL
ncbi:MAG: uroporphyrinogen-III C-methyltransferase [Bacillota bacterium]